MDFSNNPAGIPQLGFTHGGRFHADDVFSAALLRILHPDIRIYRGFTVPKGFSGIVFDIGDGPFDHHTNDRLRRENGAPYASFGLLWREYGHFFLGETEAARFDDKFIRPLDIDDNTGTGNALAGLIGAYNPSWDSDADIDEAFFNAVDIAESLLRHKLESLAAVERGHSAVEKALLAMKDNIVLLHQYVPWKPVLVTSSAEFVIFPSVRGGYSLQCIPKDFNGKTGNKVPLPSSWWGRPTEKLVEITGVSDITFCHASGFMAVVGSVDSALRLCRLAREEQQRREEQRTADLSAQKTSQGTKAP